MRLVRGSAERLLRDCRWKDLPCRPDGAGTAAGAVFWRHPAGAVA
jgi:hypothetical protein